MDITMSESERVTAESAILSLNDLDDFSRMTVGVEAKGAVVNLLNFIKQHASIDNLADEDAARAVSFFRSTYKAK
jgi:hypothetical protein